jgi:hypothetical protein
VAGEGLKGKGKGKQSDTFTFKVGEALWVNTLSALSQARSQNQMTSPHR